MAVALAVLLAACATCEPRPNLGVYRDKLIAWHISGGYDRCFAAEAEKAGTWLRRAIKASGPDAKIAVVFDIDETVLSNWPYLLERAFAINPETFAGWSQSVGALPLQPSLELYREATAAGVSIFFVTGRPESMRATTERELRNAGYAKWAALYMLPPSYKDRSVVPFKSGTRQAIASQGYRIVLNIGDQWSDLEGGEAEKAFKLPNPYYYIP